MNMFWAILFLVAGLAILWKAADIMVSGAVGLATTFGISPIVIGLTIVAMGTSAPEVAASIAAGVRGMGDAALGNVYGSNIANLALVGGLCALIRPLEMRKLTLYREIPVMLLTALALLPVLHDLRLSRPEGLILLAVFAALIALTVYAAKKGTVKPLPEDIHGAGSTPKNLILVVIGLVGLAAGADFAVRGAVFVGQAAGLSTAVIGLTIIAVGTSLPELATSTVAIARGHHDISIGNLVGSNIFNTLLVVGVAGTVRPFTLGLRLARADYWIMVGVSLAFALAAFLGRRRISRFSGLLLLLAYAAFMVYTLVFTRTV